MRRAVILVAWAVLALAVPARPAPAGEDPFRDRRQAMVEEIVRIAERVGGGAVPRRLDPAVLDAMGRVPRHELVPPQDRTRAYQDRPLPIGYGQTISQPYIVALMTHLLGVEPGDRVFELGTGSGYQAAVLAEMGVEVFSVEIVEPLAQRAARDLGRLGYAGVRVKAGDGYFGWPEAAPFDGIVVTAAASHVPPPLIEQLAPGGRMVIPVGPAFLLQHLMLVRKDAEGAVSSEILLPVRFVPLTGAGEDGR